MKNNGAAGEVIDPLISRDADLPLCHIETFPEIVAFPRKFISFFVMHFKQRINIRQFDLLCNRMCDPDHITFL